MNIVIVLPIYIFSLAFAFVLLAAWRRDWLSVWILCFIVLLFTSDYIIAWFIANPLFRMIITVIYLIGIFAIILQLIKAYKFPASSDMRMKNSETLGYTHNTAAALCYSGGIYFAILFIKQGKTKEIRFHAIQALVVDILFLVVLFFSYIMNLLFYQANPRLISRISMTVLDVFLISLLVMTLTAAFGMKLKLPFIGKFAEKKSDL